ncbi:MAG: lytic transglycosylase domain-containing protein, partial [Deltaproteobacteria bacterium]|nr:lytic transglycosylase domain-containing protein [Deltaproteobacteria bacterium]
YERDQDIGQEMMSEEERQKFIGIWEAWDPFLVHMITSLSKEPLSDDDRQILLDTLLETRYSFITEPLDGTMKRDFVRDQFITAWAQLSPVFRRHLGDVPCKDTLGYLAFFTASDALSALDEIGPTLGIEISRNGLIRLARLLGERESAVLSYSPYADPELREVLGLGMPPDASGPTFDVDELEIDTEETSSGEKDNHHLLLHAIMPIFCTPVWAAEKNNPAIQLDTIKPWIVSKEDLTPYLERIKTLLQNVSSDVLKKDTIAEKYHDLYRRIVLSATWQESCFRQFKVKKGKVTYLRSYNSTSVGLMQINERVWRGMYDTNHLRWDISYNAKAGCGIIDLYFRRYALRKMKEMKLEKSLDDDTIARLMYAMYNGGPGQFHKFLNRDKKGEYYLSDELFFEKYSWVKNHQWENISKCLVGSE